MLIRALQALAEDDLLRPAHARAEGLGVLLVEQNLYSALAVADRVSVMETGRVVHAAPAAAVAGDPGALTRFLGVH